MKKTNKLFLAIGSLSSLAALPLIAAACDNSKKEEKKKETESAEKNKNASASTTAPATPTPSASSAEREQADQPQGSTTHRKEYDLGLKPGELEDLVNAISTDRKENIEVSKRKVAETSSRVLENSEAVANGADFRGLSRQQIDHVASVADAILRNIPDDENEATEESR
ncbi:Hypothetical protein, predicted lipoprotein [Metamycoplasma auris 15026]|uniref:Uncharacterized protein n=1 Tax=Metamycoplasma auris 15026 TaxID=1188233 RepID=N9TQX8_9BACT|nr:variable surface lipoprotein [Metamycoplasma auris]ENY68475.1 Hypothetical protein, predicted lipoprotein [Metamycoplasma auris 15026]